MRARAALAIFLLACAPRVVAPAAVATLDQRALAPLRDRFNEAANGQRLLALFSPT